VIHKCCDINININIIIIIISKIIIFDPLLADAGRHDVVKIQRRWGDTVT